MGKPNCPICEDKGWIVGVSGSDAYTSDCPGCGRRRGGLMADMTLYVTAEDMRAADRSLPNPGRADEAIAITAMQAMIHLLEGGSVNGQALLPAPGEED